MALSTGNAYEEIACSSPYKGESGIAKDITSPKSCSLGEGFRQKDMTDVMMLTSVGSWVRLRGTKPDGTKFVYSVRVSQWTLRKLHASKEYPIWAGSLVLDMSSTGPNNFEVVVNFEGDKVRVRETTVGTNTKEENPRG